jgi:nucleoside recognition membrane protein YjiH
MHRLCKPFLFEKYNNNNNNNIFIIIIIIVVVVVVVSIFVAELLIANYDRIIELGCRDLNEDS